MRARCSLWRNSTSIEAGNGTFTVSLKVDKSREKMCDVGEMLQRNRAILTKVKSNLKLIYSKISAVTQGCPERKWQSR